MRRRHARVAKRRVATGCPLFRAAPARAVEKADSEAYMAVFQETKAKIDAVLAEIEAKRAEIVELSARKPVDGIDEDSITVKMTDGGSVH